MIPQKIKDIDFNFENSIVRITANRNYSEIKLGGLSIGPFEEGNDYEVYYWVASELAKSGIAHYREDDSLDAAKLYKIQWKERVQVAGQISELPNDFYPRLRRYIASVKEDIPKQHEKFQEYEKAMQTALDIINSRLKKLVTLASGPTLTDQVLKKVTPEERIIYEQLGKTIHEWRKRIIEYQNEG